MGDTLSKPSPLNENATNFRLEGSTLLAMVEIWRDGVIAQENKQYVPAFFPLDLVLGNINGTFQYGFKNFSASARHIRLEGTVLWAELQTESGSWNLASIDLNDKLRTDVKKGRIYADDVPVTIPVPKYGCMQEAQEHVISQLEESLDKNPALKLAALDHNDGTVTFFAANTDAENAAFVGFTNHSDDNSTAKVGYYRVGVDVNGMDPSAIFKTFDAAAKAAVFHVANKKGRSITELSVDLLSAKASASLSGVAGGGNEGFPVYAGVDAKINLVELKASAFDLNIGLGGQTDIGLNDYSVGAHVAGCGFTFGKKISISALGSSIGIDLGRLFS
ncbi:hypothetical protein FDECE_158 [Fusarium decemcellulare]|nr:hypothetical protein FDECE_158 [Fusarium decemcellulare]